MKKAILGIIAIVSFAFKGIAQEINDINQKAEFKSASLITTYEKEVTEYKFHSLGELNEEVEQIIRELDFSDSQKIKQNTCEVTVEIKVEVTIGTSSGLMCGLIIVNCVNAVDVAKRLKTIMLTAVME